MPVDATPALVTLHIWRAPPGRLPSALARIPADWVRLRAAARRPAGPVFAKLLGTSRPASMTPRDATPHRWALLATWDSVGDAAAFEGSPVVRGWDRLAAERCRIDLRAVVSHGAWSGRQPFGPGRGGRPDGAVAAITRARLRARSMTTFWRAVPPVAADLASRPGLLLALGIGEAPVGLQGTFSLWSSSRALSDFAYRGPAHREVIARTGQVGWYAEELFARFAVLGICGTVDGADPLAPRPPAAEPTDSPPAAPTDRPDAEPSGAAR